MQAQLSLYQQRINQQLSQSIQKMASNPCPEKLQDAITYATLDQGKRLRPALVYACGEGLQIPLEKLDVAACAVEFIHCYSLVHDDLPAMDDDDLRRGKPTTHIKYDEATAILVGDAQQNMAFQIIALTEDLSAEVKVEMLQILTHAAGQQGMIGGQQIDMDSEGNLGNQRQLEQMHQMKTGALIQAALLLGACQHPDYSTIKPLLQKYGQAIGLAFQVQDDILDIESDTETLGKPQGSDQEADKSTYPKLLGLIEAKAYRDQLILEAKQALQQLPIKSDFLFELTDYIAARDK